MINIEHVILRRTIETSGDTRYNSFRRPGIITGKNGRLILYYEAHGVDPEKHQTLFCRYSDDEGSTWSERIELAAGGSTGMLHNIMMVYMNNRYYCLWNVQYRQLWLRESGDGVHWDAPRDLTRMLWRADCSYPWNAFGIGSGHCTLLKSGRVLIPTWFTVGGDSHKPSGFANIYTDDGFQTIHIGEVIESGEDIKNPNEAAIAEIENGHVLATIRHDNEVRARAFTECENGTGKWSPVTYRYDLPDPICHASLLGTDHGLLFCNCANADPEWKANHEAGKSRYIWSNDARKDLTIRISKDSGTVFSNGILIDAKGGYNDLAYTNGTVVCIYETDWNIEESCVFPHALKTAKFRIEDII